MKAVPLILMGLLVAAGAAFAEPESGHDYWLAPTVGARTFDDKLDLERGVALGLRVGLGLDRRFGLFMDYAQSDPDEKGSTEVARVSSLRLMGVVRPVAATIQPYLMGGFGGLLFHFGDTRDGAGSSASVGGGLEYAAMSRARIFVEYSAEFYRIKMATYSSTGQITSTSDAETDAVQSITGGVSVGF